MFLLFLLSRSVVLHSKRLQWKLVLGLCVCSTVNCKDKVNARRLIFACIFCSLGCHGMSWVSVYIIIST